MAKDFVKFLREEHKRLSERLNAFLSAEQYDSERDNPASDEARFVWSCIIDKPHWALPTIQHLIDKRNEARKEVEKLRGILGGNHETKD